MGNTIEKKFKPRFKGTLQFVSNWEDFENLEIGCCAAVLPVGKGNEFPAYFEGKESSWRKGKQKIFLQYRDPVTQKMKVTSYTVPLQGKINLNDLEKGREYKVGF